MRTLALAAVLFLLPVSVGLDTAGGAADSATFQGGRGSVSSVSCAAPGTCAAGGFFTDARGRQEAFVVDETNGRWDTAIRVPGTAKLNGGGYATVNSISCAAAGECAAGGYYTDGLGDRQAFVVSEAKGRWGKAVEVPGSGSLNGGGFAELSSVSCAAPGECTGGGYYLSSIGQQAFVVSERKGRWGKAIEVPGTATLNSGGSAAVNSVSCAAIGECAAGGYYLSLSPVGQEAFVVSETKGHWGQALEVPGTAALNTWGNATVNSISCPAAGTCAAGGHYTSILHYAGEAFVVSETNGDWGSAIEVPASAALNSAGDADLLSISCGVAGNCAAGGYYTDDRQAFVVGEANGSWENAIAVPGMATLNAGGSATVNAVSCAAAGRCAAGGYYYDGSSGQQAFVVDRTKGSWRKAIEVPGTGKLNSGGAATVNAISCAAAGECAAGGEVTAGAFGQRPFVVSEKNGHWATATEVRLPVACVVPNVVGKAIGAAKNALSAADCRVGKIAYVSSTGRKGRVLAQRPAPGKHLGLGARVALIVSKVKPPKPPKPPKPVPTTPQSSKPATTHWRATPATLPANAATGEYQTVSVGSVSCASPGNCTAVGSYYTNAGDPEGLLLTEKAGHWATGVEAVLPAHAANGGTYPYVSLNSVSCASPGNCTAVGTYGYSAGGIYDEGSSWGVILTEKAGHWATGVPPPLPANASDSESVLASASCSSAGNCTAVGGYLTQDGLSGLLLTEKAGHWATGVEAGLPDGAYPSVSLASVSCSSAGNCTAVGSYGYAFGNGEGLIFTEKAGRWARGVAVSASTLTTVSCAPDGGCSGVGADYYSDRGGGGFGGAVLFTKKKGKWRQVDPVMPNGSPGEGVQLTSVSCVSGANCSAVGLYNVSIDSSAGAYGVLLNETAGKWLHGVTATPPKHASSGPQLVGISCASPDYCVAIGSYFVGADSRLTLQTKEAGTWRPGVEPPLPRDANGPEGADLSAVSCAAAVSCTVAGTYFADSSHGDAGQRVLLLDGTTKVPRKGTK